MLREEIKAVENPVYQLKMEIYEQYKGYHFMITNIKHTPQGEPYTWIGGIVRYYAKNYRNLNDFMIDEDKAEYEDSSLMFSPPDDNTGRVWSIL